MRRNRPLLKGRVNLELNIRLKGYGTLTANIYIPLNRVMVLLQRFRSKILQKET